MQLTKEFTIWKEQPKVTKPLEEITLEARVEQKREDEENIRSKYNLTVQNAPEGKTTELSDRMEDDIKTLNELCSSNDIEVSKIKSCTTFDKILRRKTKLNNKHDR